MKSLINSWIFWQLNVESDALTVAGIPVQVVRKNIKNLHIGVYPPEGHVRVAAPEHMSQAAIRAAVVTRLPWVRRQRDELAGVPRQAPREAVSGESHYFLGRRYRMRVVEADGPEQVAIEGKATLLMRVRPGSSSKRRLELLDRWYRDQLSRTVAPLLEKWADLLGVTEPHVRLRRMRTRWATINTGTRTVTFNPELVKQDLLAVEAIVVHELVHLFEFGHGPVFQQLMDEVLPDWRSRQARLQAAVLSHEDWRCAS